MIINWTDNSRSIGLIEFDLSAVPTGAVITSAKLSLFHELNPQADATYDLFRVTSSWTEAAVTFNSAPSFDGTAAASLTFTGNPGVYRDWEVTALVQGWVDGSFLNFGMWIEEIPVAGSETAYFSSSDGLDSRRPILNITYLEPTVGVPEPASLALLGTGLAALVARRRRQRQ